MSREAYIIDAVRTPIGRGKPDGWLHGIHPVDLLTMTLDEVTRRAGCPKEAVDDVVAGCVTPAEGGLPNRCARRADQPLLWLRAAGDSFCGAGDPLGRYGRGYRLR